MTGDERQATASEATNVPLIRLRGLKKTYGKEGSPVLDGLDGLDGLDWEIPRGRIVGLLGRNGAGKTTLMRCMLGLLPIDAGEIEIFGEAMPEPGGERLHRIGFVPQTFDLFKWMRVDAYLYFVASFYRHWNSNLVVRLIDDWAIDTRTKISKLSEGQRQKLAIVRAMAPEPELLVLDEPVASLDPQTRAAFMRELTDRVQASGCTVVLSTHITADLERANADIALLENGRLILESPLATLRERVRRIELSRSAGWAETPAVHGVLSQKIDGTCLRLIIDGVDQEQLARVAERCDARYTIEPVTLEEAFVALP